MFEWTKPGWNSLGSWSTGNSVYEPEGGQCWRGEAMNLDARGVHPIVQEQVILIFWTGFNIKIQLEKKKKRNRLLEEKQANFLGYCLTVSRESTILPISPALMVMLTGSTQAALGSSSTRGVVRGPSCECLLQCGGCAMLPAKILAGFLRVSWGLVGASLGETLLSISNCVLGKCHVYIYISYTC